MDPGKVELCSLRTYNKGTQLYGRALTTSPQESNFRRLLGLVSINTYTLGRSGEVDATELDPGNGNPFFTQEQFYFTKQYSGDKRIEPIQVTCNKVPKLLPTQNADSFIGYPKLVEWYGLDHCIEWQLSYRNGERHVFQGQVHSIEEPIPEGSSLVKVSFTILVNEQLTVYPAP